MCASAMTMVNILCTKRTATACCCSLLNVRSAPLPISLFRTVADDKQLRLHTIAFMTRCSRRYQLHSMWERPMCALVVQASPCREYIGCGPRCRAPSANAPARSRHGRPRKRPRCVDPVSCLLRFLSPANEQLQQGALVCLELLQWLALDARHNPRNEPARKAHLDHGDQRAIRFEGRGGSVQVVQLLHGGALHRFTSALTDAICRRPIASPLEVCVRRPRCAPLHLHGAGIRKPSQKRPSRGM